MDNTLNLFWSIVWAVILACIVGGLFGSKVSLIIGGALAFGMLTMFVIDYIKVKRLK